MSDQAVASAIYVLGAMTALFTALKVTGSIAWSWWAVLAPVWGPWAIVGLAMVWAGAFLLIAGALDLYLILRSR